MPTEPKNIQFVRITVSLGHSFEIRADTSFAPLPGQSQFEATSGLAVLREVLGKLRTAHESSPPASSIRLFVNEQGRIVEDPTLRPRNAGLAHPSLERTGSTPSQQAAAALLKSIAEFLDKSSSPEGLAITTTENPPPTDEPPASAVKNPPPTGEPPASAVENPQRKSKPATRGPRKRKGT